ncbi:MAG: MotA/TolQ/ExbB proton channel family protein [Deinococcus sp.]|uniref:MotA/TolQ/ExbB proton channel family protein n=1 Tax=Deinococcus sp. TaxID=47478 RepID=UPI0026DC0579|nr:MotA/TolQ/ExbB proton channel family protein [Deinococcus sp.]MDO4246525.1 MotA/TolQ/ExbB proton channel family protein [Deinococcus sp.]
MNVLDLARSAGPLLWVILALSLYVVYLAVVRLLALLRMGQDATILVERARALTAESGPTAALREVDLSGLDTPVAQVLRAGLVQAERGTPEAAPAAMNAVMIREDEKIYAGLSGLGTAAQIAPLLGLLGTVIGMVRSFLVFSQTTNPTPTQLATGISEALINTAAGLIVAIVAYVARNALRNKANAVAAQADRVREELPGWLGQPRVTAQAPFSRPVTEAPRPATLTAPRL